METITGIIEAISQKEKRYSLKIGDSWYGSFGKAPCKKGDRVSVTYKIDGNWKNIDNLNVVEKSPDIVPANEIPEERIEKSNEKLNSMLCSYSKDLAIAMLNNKAGDKLATLNSLFADTDQAIWDSYQYFLKKLNPPQIKPIKELKEQDYEYDY